MTTVQLCCPVPLCEAFARLTTQEEGAVQLWHVTTGISLYKERDDGRLLREGGPLFLQKLGQVRLRLGVHKHKDLHLRNSLIVDEWRYEISL